MYFPWIVGALAAEAGAVFVVAFLVFLEKFTGINFFFMILAPHSKFESV